MVPWTDPKLVPATVTDVPVRAESGDMLLMLGAGIVKLKALLAIPLPEVTTMFPLVVRAGTAAVMLVLFQLEIVAPVLLKESDPEPWLAPKLLPLIVTDVPAGPDAGESELMTGTGSGVTVRASLAVLNRRVTLWRLPAVFFNSRIPISRSVEEVVRVVVTWQLFVLTAAVLNAVLMLLTWQRELTS